MAGLGVVSALKTAFGSEQLTCLKALTALRIAYQTKSRLAMLIVIDVGS